MKIFTDEVKDAAIDVLNTVGEAYEEHQQRKVDAVDAVFDGLVLVGRASLAGLKAFGAEVKKGLEEAVAEPQEGQEIQ
jgi:hypothetical protein